MNDINNRKDIEQLVDDFYEKVHNEPHLAPVFIMPPEQFDRHIIRVVNFWENWLFQTGSYQGGMMWTHLQKHQEYPLTTDLFERWLALWFMTVDELFTGEKADFVKKKALEIGEMMNARLNTTRLPEKT